MKNLMNRLGKWLGIAVLAAGLGATHLFAAEGALFHTVAITPGQKSEDIQNVLATTLIGREWTVTKRSDNEVMATLKHKDREANVTLVYDTSKVEIYCKGWIIDSGTGVRKREEIPVRWMRYLRKDLYKRLAGIDFKG